MSVTTNSLRELHELHQRISRLKDQIARGPRQLEAKRKHLTQRNEALEKVKAELKTAKVKSHEKETERKSFDARINQLQTQINTAKSNKEYSTLVSEKDSAAKLRAAVEDLVLEFLVQEEEKAKEIQIIESEIKRLQQELAELENSTAQQGSEFGAKLADAESQLATVEASLPNDVRDVYRRLLDRRGADALAAAAGGTCTGCYTGITPQMQNQLLMNELVVCKSCGRILYLADAPAPVEAH
jgi:predicted  nucleic acid-binding Zn-ribbon protein